MNAIHPILARALAPFTPPEQINPAAPSASTPTPADPIPSGVADRGGTHIEPSMVVDCPACNGGWRDQGERTVMCGQCKGTGRRATNGGEP